MKATGGTVFKRHTSALDRPGGTLSLRPSHLNLGRLYWLAYKSPPGQRYSKHEIPKKSGREPRTIHAPNASLKFAQRALLPLLEGTYEARDSVHGFVREKSVKTNAGAHIGSRYVLNVDIANFFPSITPQRIQGLLTSKPYELTSTVAHIITELCTHPDGFLPQGSPTSPILSNMICWSMDGALQRLASQFRCTYSRYADDMTFSYGGEPFPQAIARYPIAYGTSQVVIGTRLRSLIRNHGFDLNYGKSRLQVSWSRQEVTGLTVNEKINVRRSYVKNLRAILHNWKHRGYEDTQRRYRALRRGRKKNDEIELRRAVKGRLDYLKMIRGDDDPLYRRYMDEYHSLADAK